MKTAIINGQTVEAPAGAVAYKYADPIEPATWLTDEADAAAIEQIDSALIVWVTIDEWAAESLRAAE